MPSIDYKCKCGAIASFSREEVGELKRCNTCLSSFMVPFESSPNTKIAPDVAFEDPDERSVLRMRAPLTDNVAVDFGTSFPLAYEASGAPGDLGKLVLAGFPAIGTGVAAGAACVGGALGLHALHAAVPYFIFIVPIVILVILTISPAVLGWVTCQIISKSVQEAKCRHPAAVGAVALLWTFGAVAFLTVAAQFFTAEGKFFLADIVVPFVRETTAYCLTYEYIEDLDPVNVPSWVIYSILAGSAILGLYAAHSAAVRRVIELPYCERCERYMQKNTLWSLSPVHALKTVAAFVSLDYKDIQDLSYCDFSKNRIDVEVWGCFCRAEYILELTGYATALSLDGEETLGEREPVRIFSRKLSLGELNRVRESGVTA